MKERGMIDMRKRIGIVSAGWNDEYQKKVVRGIIDSCKERDYDTISLTCTNIDYLAEEQNRCSYNIYNLLNQEYIDGLILLVNIIYYPEVIENILKKAETMTIPVVCVDLERDGLLYVGTDNYNSAKIMVDHLLEDESRSRYACVTGVPTNPESQIRLQAFQDAVTEKLGQKVLDHYIFNGYFQKAGGKEAARFWHESEEPFPDAVFCGNDASARGFLDTAIGLGYRVPEDVKIVSFDNTFNGQYAAVPLSSLASPLVQIGNKAVEMISAVFDGKEIKAKEKIPGIPHFRESSGVIVERTLEHYKGMHEKLAKKEKEDENNLYLANLMTEQIAFCSTIEEMVGYLKDFVGKIKCQKFYLCFTREQVMPMVDCPEFEGDERVGYMLEGYSSQMYNAMVYENGELYEPKVFDTNKLLPDIWEEKKDRTDYVFMPLYYMGKTLGYCAMANCAGDVYGVSFQTFMSFLGYVVNNFFLQQELDRKAKELEFLHERDAMTGAYNRLGFGKRSDKMLKECVKKQSSMMVLFADMDDMKYINDRFGHEEGDRAICTFCSTLMNQCKRGEIVARFGGDEMVVFAIDYTENDAIEFIKNFQKDLDVFNAENTLYELRVSIGYDIFKPDADTIMDKCINSADANMYQEKYRRKKKRLGQPLDNRHKTEL